MNSDADAVGAGMFLQVEGKPQLYTFACLTLGQSHEDVETFAALSQNLSMLFVQRQGREIHVPVSCSRAQLAMNASNRTQWRHQVVCDRRVYGSTCRAKWNRCLLL
jgi:hypothetical protein